MKKLLLGGLILLNATFALSNTLVIVAGNSVHRWGDHENLQMAKLYKELLKQACPTLAVNIVNVAAGEKLDLAKDSPTAILVIGEGEDNHPLKDNPSILLQAHDKKINIGAVHYALHFNSPQDYNALDKTIGGHYEPYWSVNPTWKANFKLKKHEITKGVQPFTIDDEYYFNIRFENTKDRKIIPIATAIPPDNVRTRAFGAHSGNPYVRINKGKAETLVWVVENSNSTRGLGYAGGHSIWDFANKDFRKLMLNAAAWLAEMKIPDDGLNSSMPDFDKIAAQIDKPARPDDESYKTKWRAFIEANK